ncbi:MAG: DNA mismatch repair protein MutS [bacterium]
MAEVERTLAERRERLAALERQDARFANVRLAIVTAALAAGIAGLALRPAWMALLPVAVVAFVVTAFRHADLLRALERARRAVTFHERRRALVVGEWAGTGASGDRFRAERHDYAADLDLFGSGSLFELVCAARTWLGEETCARWLLAPAQPATIHERQAAARELVTRLEVREALWVAASPEVRDLDPAALVRWAAAPPRIANPRRLRAAALAISACTILALALRFSGHPWGPFLLAPAALIHVAFLLRTQRAAQQITEAIDRVEPALAAAHESLSVIERDDFTSDGLRAARRRLEPRATAAHGASESVRRLHRIADWIDNLHDFYLAAFVAPVVFWRLHSALALEEWRAANGGCLGDWLATLGEVETLAGFAAVAESHPSWAWPEVHARDADSRVPPRIEARDLGHPLLAPARRVANDLELGPPPSRQLWMVSGSNMSGKSTWLRSIGSATVMALAGAPVCARSMRLERVKVVTSLRVVDSLSEGASHFLAEVKRLKRALDLAEQDAATLFLFDEILHGTNSRERTVGARALVDRLVGCGAVGLVTTHDLALVTLADELGERAANVHFADQVEDGRMLFDYRLRAGVLTSTNALAVMRSVGIALDFQETPT